MKLLTTNMRVLCKPCPVNSFKYNYSTSQKSNNNFNYCVESVKSTEYNTYLSTLIVPQNLIRPSFAIKAFNIELMSIKKSRYDQNLSQIKLMFWKEQVDKIFQISKGNEVTGNKLNEPVSSELLSMVKTHDLSKAWFNRLIEGRKKFLSTDQFKSMDELEKYGDSQMASIYFILLSCMKVRNNVDCDHVASHLGEFSLF